MSLTLSKAGSTDLPAILPMVDALARFHGDESCATLATLQDALAYQTHFILARLDGQAVGYGALLPLAQLQFGVRGFDLHHLFVCQKQRGTGVGRAMIKACVALSKAEGARYLTVGTVPGNRAAQRIYRAAGFVDLPAPGPRLRIKW